MHQETLSSWRGKALDRVVLQAASFNIFGESRNSLRPNLHRSLGILRALILNPNDAALMLASLVVSSLVAG